MFRRNPRPITELGERDKGVRCAAQVFFSRRGRVFSRGRVGRGTDGRQPRHVGWCRVNGENCRLGGAWAEDGGRFQKRNLLHCSACDLGFVPAAEQVSADQARARYWRHRNTPEDAGYVAMLSGIIELLHVQSPTARRVLDYGSGPTPVLVELLREAGHEAAGYESAYPTCQITRANLNGDGAMNGLDIPPFVACVLNAGCP